MLKRLLICAVCGWPGGCAVMDDFPFSDLGTGLGQAFESVADMAESTQDIAEAATAGARALEGFEKNMDSLGDLARELRSMPWPGEAAEQVTPGERFNGTAVTCGPAPETRESAVRGAFTGDGKRTRLFLSHDCRLRHEDGPEAEFLGTPDSASLKALCRDPVSGRENAVFFTHAGASSSAIEVWGVDPPSGALEPLYMEGWGDMESGGHDRWNLKHLVAGVGTCLWRERQEARETVKAAMAALRVRAAGDEGPDRIVPGTMPTRGIRAETVGRWLTALERAGSAAILEGTVYIDVAGWASWRVIQILSTTLHEWDGVVLLLDRRAGTWQAIGNVSLDHPMLGMVVMGDRLYAAICVAGCHDGRGYGGDAAYETLVVDLRTKRATLLRDPPYVDPDRKNPPIRNIREELLSQ